MIDFLQDFVYLLQDTDDRRNVMSLSTHQRQEQIIAEVYHSGRVLLKELAAKLEI